MLKRFRIYKYNMKVAKLWQDNEDEELSTAIYGETQFMDLSPDEFRQVTNMTIAIL